MTVSDVDAAAGTVVGEAVDGAAGTTARTVPTATATAAADGRPGNRMRLRLVRLMRVSSEAGGVAAGG
ncbi:hypothetical protein ACUJ8N_31300 [Streptomyces sp. ESR1.13]|uniref:hypothetical protein n=1 Tax=unclassified Streptomyces TaxID=2593676 RepID=UPI004042A406